VKAQRLHRGDVVHVAKDLGQSMSHFKNDFEAVVIGSYADQFYSLGPNNVDNYTLADLDTGSEISWYHDSQLTFLRHGGEELIQSIEKARAERHAEQSTLEWIVPHWNSAGQVSLQALSNMIGFGDLWGRRGEGIDLFYNMEAVRSAFDQAMQTGDIAVVKARIEELSALVKTRRGQ
jgi:hypothetical protein